MTFTIPIAGFYGKLGCFTNKNSNGPSSQYNPSSLIYASNAQPPLFYALEEGVPNVNSISNPCQITFPQEELAFGRDITIDALYVSLWAQVQENITLNFYVTLLQNNQPAGSLAVYIPIQQLYASYVLTPAMFDTLEGDPIELQLSSEPNYGSGAWTGHSPQLQVEIVSPTDNSSNQVRFVKKAIFASFDPAQRPM
jgi:hypothetical protein